MLCKADIKEAKRYLTAHLFYTPSCPSDYCPPGFQPNSEPNILVPHSGEWRVQASRIGGTDFGLLK